MPPYKLQWELKSHPNETKINYYYYNLMDK